RSSATAPAAPPSASLARSSADIASAAGSNTVPPPPRPVRPRQHVPSTPYQGAVAQLVAHHTGSVGVRGASPLSSTLAACADVSTVGRRLSRHSWCDALGTFSRLAGARWLPPVRRFRAGA